MTDVSSVIPKHGTVSVNPATRWEDGLAAGNGTMGVMLYGNPTKDTILVNHCKLWLPAGSREILPNAGDVLPEMRRIIAAQGYEAGQKFFLKKARESGWGGNLVWTDAFHPGFFLKLLQPQDGDITDFARVEDFSTGEVWAQWHTPKGEFSRRLFVSRTDNTIVSKTTGPKGDVSLKVTMEKLGNGLINSTVTQTNGWIFCHNVYVKGKGGYDGAVRVISEGGKQQCEEGSITVDGADSVTLLIRILPWRTPLPTSQAWPNDPANPDFEGGFHAAKRGTVQIAGKEYDARWMEDLRADLQSMPGDYTTLFRPHAAAWSKLFNRVSVDFGGSPEERAMSSEAILDKAQKDKRLSPALLERMYDAGRYVYLCAAGPETPPNLFGIWTGTWQPAWSGDYTTDTNLQLDNELVFSANLAELLNGYFHLWNSFLPDFRRNAKVLYNCRGIMTGSRASNNGLALHWSDTWPGNIWTPGASWIAHWYYDYYQYTGDREFLRTNAIPFMKECALFWEDFLKGTEDASGHYVFRPSYSAENGWGDNTSQDIEITTELLTNLIAGCETLGIEKEGVVRWKALLAKLPPLLINKEGQLKEWSNPIDGESNDHRHLMHLYGAFESQQFSEETDPKLFNAARVAVLNRVNASNEDATHGYMHTGLAAVSLGLGNLAFARIEQLAKRRSIYPSMVDGHYGGPQVLCDDGNGTTPEIVNRMLVQSKLGSLSLLPAMPRVLPKGTVTGLKARGAITVDTLSWDLSAGTCSATLTSDSKQTIALVLPRDVDVKTISVNGKSVPVTTQGVKKLGAEITLPAKSAVKIDITFAGLLPMYPDRDKRNASPGKTTYTIDPVKGEDMSKINALRLKAGDRGVILPGVHEGSMVLCAEGTEQNPVEIHFAPGKHEFRAGRAVKLAYYVSNSADDPKNARPIGILVKDCRHVRITGQHGTELRLGDRMTYLINDHSENVEYSGLTFDMVRPTISEFRVMEADDKTAKIRIAESSDYTFIDGHFEWSGDLGSGDTMVQDVLLEPAQCWRSGYEPLKNTKFESLGERWFKLSFTNNNTGLKAGHQFQFRNITRDNTSVVNTRSKNITFRNCRFYSLPGMGIVSQFTENLVFDHVRIVPRPDTMRTAAAWADCLQFSGCREL